MRSLIKQILNEETQLNEVKLNKESLIHDLMVMDFDYYDAEIELENHIEWYNSLPKVLTLYRVIFVDDETQIKTDEPGKHYSMDKSNLIDSHSYASGYGDKEFLLTVVAKKSMIDAQSTISNNILYPNEKEITLKNNGKGAKIINIEEIQF